MKMEHINARLIYLLWERRESKDWRLLNKLILLSLSLLSSFGQYSHSIFLWKTTLHPTPLSLMNGGNLTLTEVQQSRNVTGRIILPSTNLNSPRNDFFWEERCIFLSSKITFPIQLELSFLKWIKIEISINSVDFRKLSEGICFILWKGWRSSWHFVDGGRGEWKWQRAVEISTLWEDSKYCFGQKSRYTKLSKLRSWSAEPLSF